jgi:hypothetical protein
MSPLTRTAQIAAWKLKYAQSKRLVFIADQSVS